MTLSEWRKVIHKALSSANFENSPEEAKWLLAAALERDNAYVTLNPIYSPSPTEEMKIREWLERRLQGEPLSRIKGIREFWSLSFQLNDSTLDPRPETEGIVEAVLKWVGSDTSNSWHILDLGTGSGCILIALLHELQNATGIGSDIEERALSQAYQNALLNGVERRASFLKSNWGESLEGPFDIIVCNPPYIPLTEKDKLEQGVLNFDPPKALFGGEDGLECYRILSQEIKYLLSPKGLAVLEMGMSQRKEVEKLFTQAGFNILFIHKDLYGIERVMGIAKKN